MDQKLDSICVLKHKPLLGTDSLIVMTLCEHYYRFTQIFNLYLWFYFKTLELLFVVNSGIVCYIVKMNSLPITAKPGKRESHFHNPALMHH